MWGRSRIVALGVMVLCAGCGGGGSAAKSLAPAAPAGPATAGSLTLVMAAGGATASTARKPQFVSPSSSSVGVRVNGGTATFSDVSSSSPNCTTANNTRTCTIAVTAPAGTPTILVDLYDGPNGTGHNIAQGSATPTVTLGTPFTAPVTMAPVVAALTGGSVTYLSGTSFVKGTSGSATVTISSADADGTAIPSTATFAGGITLTSSDAHVTITPALWGSPSQAIHLAYDGSASVANTVTITFANGSTTLIAIPLALSGGSTMGEFTIPTASSFPEGISSGPDGNVWFVENSTNKIGRISSIPIGTFAEFVIPTANSLPIGIASGPDGNLWFTESQGPGGNNKIGRITTAGVITEFGGLSAFSGPHDITAGPDGALWFTETNSGAIGRITTAGVVTEFPIPTGSTLPWGIVSGPDGALWFTESNASALIKGIGRITTAGVVTEFTIPTPGSGSEGIAVGPDGALWFTEHASAGNRVGRVTTAGIFTECPQLPQSGSLPLGITAGPDGALWFTEDGSSRIGRMTTACALTEFDPPTINSGPYGIILGPDGNLWFTEQNGNKIAHIQFPFP